MAIQNQKKQIDNIWDWGMAWQVQEIGGGDKERMGIMTRGLVTLDWVRKLGKQESNFHQKKICFLMFLFRAMKSFLEIVQQTSHASLARTRL